MSCDGLLCGHYAWVVILSFIRKSAIADLNPLDAL